MKRSRPRKLRTAAPVERGVVNRVVLALERFPGRIMTSALVAVLLMWLATWRVPLGTRPTYLGKSYAMLSFNPFAPDPTNPVAYRILAPLVSWLVRLRGPDLIITNLAIATILLGLVYDWLRRAGHSPQRALLGASTVALSMVTLTTVHYGGYTDSLTYLMVFLAWRARARIPLACGLFYLATLNHESALFLLPWMFYVFVTEPASHSRMGLRAGAGLVAVVAAFLLTRHLLERLTPGVQYTGTFYLEPLLKDPLHWYRESAGHRMLGVLAVFNLYWIFPVLAAVRMARRRELVALGGIALPFLCAYAQLFVAYDVTRLLALSFMGMLLGVEYVLRTGAFHDRRWALWLSVGNFFIPQINVAMGVMDVMR